MALVIPGQVVATEFLVHAEIAKSNAANKPAYLIRRGEAERGTILLRLNRLEQGNELWSQARDLEGALGWLPAVKPFPIGNEQADNYITRAIARDPDLWVVEIEDREGVNPFPGKVIG